MNVKKPKKTTMKTNQYSLAYVDIVLGGCQKYSARLITSQLEAH